MNELASILQNPQKIEQLILKLKTIGEDSPQFQTFKTNIDSFQLNKPPRGVHQINILQHVFKYSDSRECFDSFRLVCKSWKNAVETIRLDALSPLGIFQELCLHERNGHFPPFYSKYLKTFRKLHLRLDRNFTMVKWNSIATLLIDSMKNLDTVVIRISCPIPTDFVIFLFNLFKNSQSTLKIIGIVCKVEMCTFPAISLPNLTNLAIRICPNHQNKVQSFDYLMKTFVDVMCPNLKLFSISDIHTAPQILKYITQNYPNHFVCAPEISTLEHIPLKLSYLNLEKLAACRYTSHIEYLILHVKNLQASSEGGWDDYKEILSFFPNLKGVCFYYNRKCTNLVRFLIPLRSPLAQTIWQQRIDYFKSQNIRILSRNKYSEIISGLLQSLSPSWGFEFKL
jgi:hypothetical protein